jgi:hypothetical protein
MFLCLSIAICRMPIRATDTIKLKFCILQRYILHVKINGLLINLFGTVLGEKEGCFIVSRYFEGPIL